MEAAAAARAARPSWANLRTALGLLLFCSALLGGQRIIEGSSRTEPVWAAARDLGVNARLGPGDLRVVEVRLPSEQATHYLAADASVEGAVLTRPVRAGELLAAQWVSTTPPEGAGRSMTIPVGPDNAPAGGLRAGDRIDVLATFDAGDARSSTRALATGVEVIGVVRSGGLVMGGEAVVGLTVAVTPEQAAQLASAIHNAVIDVVRVDGASAAGSYPTVRSGEAVP